MQNCSHKSSATTTHHCLSLSFIFPQFTISHVLANVDLVHKQRHSWQVTFVFNKNYFTCKLILFRHLLGCGRETIKRHLNSFFLEHDFIFLFFWYIVLILQPLFFTITIYKVKKFEDFSWIKLIASLILGCYFKMFLGSFFEPWSVPVRRSCDNHEFLPSFCAFQSEIFFFEQVSEWPFLLPGWKLRRIIFLKSFWILVKYNWQAWMETMVITIPSQSPVKLPWEFGRQMQPFSCKISSIFLEYKKSLLLPLVSVIFLWVSSDSRIRQVRNDIRWSTEQGFLQAFWKFFLWIHISGIKKSFYTRNPEKLCEETEFLLTDVKVSRLKISFVQ